MSLAWSWGVSGTIGALECSLSMNAPLYEYSCGLVGQNDTNHDEGKGCYKMTDVHGAVVTVGMFEGGIASDNDRCQEKAHLGKG